MSCQLGGAVSVVKLHPGRNDTWWRNEEEKTKKACGEQTAWLQVWTGSFSRRDDSGLWQYTWWNICLIRRMESEKKKIHPPTSTSSSPSCFHLVVLVREEAQWRGGDSVPPTNQPPLRWKRTRLAALRPQCLLQLFLYYYQGDFSEAIIQKCSIRSRSYVVFSVMIFFFFLQLYSN